MLACRQKIQSLDYSSISVVGGLTILLTSNTIIYTSKPINSGLPIFPSLPTSNCIFINFPQADNWWITSPLHFQNNLLSIPPHLCLLHSFPSGLGVKPWAVLNSFSSLMFEIDDLSKSFNSMKHTINTAPTPVQAICQPCALHYLLTNYTELFCLQSLAAPLFSNTDLFDVMEMHADLESIVLLLLLPRMSDSRLPSSLHTASSPLKNFYKNLNLLPSGTFYFSSLLYTYSHLAWYIFYTPFWFSVSSTIGI